MLQPVYLKPIGSILNEIKFNLNMHVFVFYNSWNAKLKVS